MSDRYLYEFFWRGRDPVREVGVAADYHVRVAQFIEVLPGKVEHVCTDPLTPQQATAAGFTLPTILATINAQTMADLEAANARAADLEARLVEAQNVIAEWIGITEQRDRSIAGLQSDNAALETVIAELRVELTESLDRERAAGSTVDAVIASLAEVTKERDALKQQIAAAAAETEPA